MSGRVSNTSRYESAVTVLQRRQAEMSEAQMQMTSGKRVSKPSDDPTAAARAERAFIAQQRIESAQRSVGVSRSAMALTESALGRAGDLLQNAREKLISAGNGTYSGAERAALATDLVALRGQLLQLANQTDGAGGYIFGGQGTLAPPFVDSAGGVTFAGTSGQGQLSTSEQMPTSVDGESVWLSARSGNGVFVTGAAAANTGSAFIDAGGVADPSVLTGQNYQVVFNVAPPAVTTYAVSMNGVPTGQTGNYIPGGAITVDGMTFDIGGAPANGDAFDITPSTPDMDPFEALDRAIAVLSDPNATRGAIAQSVNSGVRDVDAVMSHFSANRSVAGAALSRLDAIESRNQDRDLWAKSVQSDAEDLDMVKAVSEFQNKQTSYQAALQSYAMVQSMSLFDYLK
ncbi:flagellar hook-associated protein FlgL [Aquincola sp. S2]|uniref:Flagellar hook-associated protein FlgL n=1 Tax=Pseudaquabacterium terrae TaxID=2732868 RepID=A0ABX2ENT0_9BURK|nr:flagellar hook-associated protein FlgL [Aquabacterium terrae]NRF70337.1 flagellar hook-associated protein FlgL [Aquabacterium terrae]